MKLLIEIVTPEKIVFKEENAEEVLIPTPNGQIGILPHHLPLLTQVTSGELVVKKGKTTQFLAITSGFAEIANNKITILADYAVRSEEIEIAKAQEAKKRAEQLLNEKISAKDFAIAEADLRRSILELKVAQRRRARTLTM